MKLFLLLCLSSCAVAHAFHNYHEAIGIPRAEELRRAEEAKDFDGSRIINGQPAPLGAFPHMAGLVITLSSGSLSVCGSSLISNTKLLTAAHCWWDGMSFASLFTVVLGSTTIWSGGVRINTNNVQIHEEYEPWTVRNDVAIITIPWIAFNNVIQPINLASGSNSFAGSWATAAGFGLTADGGGISSILNYVSLQVISNDECAQTFGPSVVVSSTLCTSGAGRGICTSDSGGPLSIGNQLVGIVSFGAQSCEAGFPSGYAKVSSYISWIQARM